MRPTPNELEAAFAQRIVAQYFRRPNGTINWPAVCELVGKSSHHIHRGAEPIGSRGKRHEAG